MADEVVFTAQVGPWVCVKKFKAEANTRKIDVARGLASVHDSMDRKIWECLKEDFPTDELDKLAYEIAGAEYDEKKKDWFVRGRKSEEQIAAALAKLSSPSTTKRINVDTKNGMEIAKAYLSRKVLDLLGFRLELDPAVVDKYIGEKAKRG
jgi:hypothetical protein